MQDESFDGDIVTVAIGGGELLVPIKRKKATLKINDLAGQYTITLTDCEEVPPVDVDCSA